MTDDASPPPAPPEEATAPPPAPAPWWRRHRWKLIVAAVLLTPVLCFALYSVVALSWSYSEGQRAGTLLKFSKKGWVCKTWEGELMQPTAPGVAPTIWYFTVRDGDVARQVSLGVGRQVVLYYQEHRGVPTACFGDTRYFVDSLRITR